MSEFVTSSVAVFESTAMRVKSMYMTKSLLKTRKKGENMKIREILHNSFSKR